MKLRWSPRAKRDLRQIVDFIAFDDREAALRWGRRLFDRALKASTMPRAGRRVPEVDRDDIREVFVGAYRIMYRVEARAIVVLAVIEGHRQVPPDDVDV